MTLLRRLGSQRGRAGVPSLSGLAWRPGDRTTWEPAVNAFLEKELTADQIACRSCKRRAIHTPRVTPPI